LQVSVWPAPAYMGTASGVNASVVSPLTPLAVPLLVKPRLWESEDALPLAQAAFARPCGPAGQRSGVSGRRVPLADTGPAKAGEERYRAGQMLVVAVRLRL
jgi:hypothetical protein